MKKKLFFWIIFFLITFAVGLFAQSSGFIWALVKQNDVWRIGYITSQEKNKLYIESPFEPYKIGYVDKMDVCYPERFVMVEKDERYYLAGMLYATGTGTLIRYCYERNIQDEWVEDPARISSVVYLYPRPVYENSIYITGVIEDVNHPGTYIIRYHGFGKEWETQCTTDDIQFLQNYEEYYSP
jgi:hypothetical protein